MARLRTSTLPTQPACTDPRCVGLHRGSNQTFLCKSCKVWHPLPCNLDHAHEPVPLPSLEGAE